MYDPGRRIFEYSVLGDTQIAGTALGILLVEMGISHGF